MLKKLFLLIIVAAALSGCAAYGGHANHGSSPGPGNQGNGSYYDNHEHPGDGGGGGGGC